MADRQQNVGPEASRKKVGRFFDAIINNPVTAVANPNAALAMLAQQLANSGSGINWNAGGPSAQTLQRNQRVTNDQNQWAQAQRASGQSVEAGNQAAWEQEAAALNQSPKDLPPPAGVDKAARKNPAVAQAFAPMAEALGMNPQAFVPQAPSTAIQEGLRQAQPFQEDPSGQGRSLIERGFDAVQAHNRTSPDRITGWDTNKEYNAVSRLSQKDYDRLNSVKSREEFFEESTNTVLKTLESAGITMSEEQLARFKAGVEPAMQDWYNMQKSAGRPTDVTAYYMAMSEMATRLANEVPVPEESQTQPTGEATTATATPTAGGTPTLDDLHSLLRSPEFLVGYNSWKSKNPEGTPEAFLSLLSGGT